MFDVNEYKIVFKRCWHGCHKKVNGRYDTVCEIYVKENGVYSLNPFTGVAKLHPNDSVDRITGKKLALRDAMIKEYMLLLITKEKIPVYQKEKVPVYHLEFHIKSKRTAIWEAFWGWVATWPSKVDYNLEDTVARYCRENNVAIVTKELLTQLKIGPEEAGVAGAEAEKTLDDGRGTKDEKVKVKS